MKKPGKFLYMALLLGFCLVLAGVFLLRNTGGGLRLDSARTPETVQTAPAGETERQDMNRAALEALLSKH